MPKVIKIVDANNQNAIAQAIGEIEGAGFILSQQMASSYLLVDASKHGGGEQTYGGCVVLIGEK
jgi:hypothetical protein